MQIAQKEEIYKREKALIHYTSKDQLRLIYRGVKRAVRLIRKVRKQKKININKAFSIWKNILSQPVLDNDYSLAADDFRNSILLTKALQSWTNYINFRKIKNTLIQQSEVQRSQRLTLKVIYVLSQYTSQQKQRKNQIYLATTFWADRKQDLIFQAWRLFSHQRKQLHKVQLLPLLTGDQDSHATCTKVQSIDYSKQQEPFLQIYQELHDESSSYTMIAQFNIKKKVFGWLKQNYFKISCFKAKKVEQIFRDCLQQLKTATHMQRDELSLIKSFMAKQQTKRVMNVWKGIVASRKHTQNIISYFKTQLIVRCFSTLQLHSQRVKQKKETMDYAAVFYCRQFLFKSFQAFVQNHAIRLAQKLNAIKLYQKKESGKLEKCFTALTKSTLLNKLGKALKGKVSCQTKQLKIYLRLWKEALEIQRQLKPFIEKWKKRHALVYLKTNQIENRSDREKKSVIGLIVKRNILIQVFKAMITRTNQSLMLKQLSLRVSKRDKMVLLKVFMNEFKFYTEQSQLKFRLNQTANNFYKRHTKRSFISSLREYSSSKRQMRDIVINQAKNRAKKIIKEFYFICQMQKSLRDRLIEFGSNRLKKNCLGIFGLWRSKAQKLSCVRGSLQSKVNYLQSKRALRKLNDYAKQLGKDKELQKLTAERSQIVLKTKVFQGFRANKERPMTKNRKKAKSYFRMSLLIKAMQALNKFMQVGREVSQIVVERQERTKFKFLKLWSQVLAEKRKEMQIREAIKVFKKRQNILKLRVFLRIMKEKRLKNHAAKCFRCIWLKRRAMNELFEYLFRKNQKRLMQRQIVNLQKKKRLARVFHGWVKTTKADQKRKAIGYLVQRKTSSHLVSKYFSKIKRIYQIKYTVIAVWYQSQNHLCKRALNVLKRYNQLKKQKRKIDKMQQQEVKLIKIRQVFKRFLNWKEMKIRLRQTLSKCLASKKNSALEIYLTTLSNYAQRKKRLRVGLKRVTILHKSNLKRMIFQQMIKRFEQMVNRKRKRESLEDSFQNNQEPIAKLRASMFDFRNLQASTGIPNCPMSESVSRLFKTPFDKRVIDDNRLLNCLSQEKKIEIFTQRINQKLEARSNRSCSTKLRSRSNSRERAMLVVQNFHQQKHRQVDSSSTRPPLLPSVAKKINRVFPENSLSPKIGRTPNMRYSSFQKSTESFEQQQRLTLSAQSADGPKSFRQLSLTKVKRQIN